MAESKSIDPKIKHTLYVFSPQNKAKIKSILLRINKELWSDVVKSEKFKIILNKIAESQISNKVVLIQLLYAKLKYYGYPYDISLFINQFNLNGLETFAKVELNEILIAEILHLVDEIIYETDFKIDKFIQIDKLDGEKSILAKDLVDEKFILNKDDGQVVVENQYIPDNEELNYNSVFGFKSNFNVIQMQMINQKIEMNVENIIKYVLALPWEKTPTLYKYSQPAIEAYFKAREPRNCYDCNTAIIINNNVNIEDLIDERKIHFLVAKNNIRITKPNCKMRNYIWNIEDIQIISIFENIDQIRTKIDDIIANFKGYPVFGTVAFVNKEKYGYYVVSKTKELLRAMEINYINKNIMIDFPIIKLNEKPVYDQNGLNIHINFN